MPLYFVQQKKETETKKAIQQLQSLNAFGICTLDAIEKSSSANDPDAIDETLNLFWLNFLESSNSMHRSLDQIVSLASTEKRISFMERATWTQDIEAVAEDGKLLLRCPHPPHRFKKGKDCFTEYRQAINYQIQKIVHELELSKQKIIYILNVYPENTDNSRMLDFDNYDLKSILDEVCRPYPNSDNPGATSIVMCSDLTNQLPPYTYLAVLPVDGKDDLPQGFAALTPALFQCFGK